MNEYGKWYCYTCRNYTLDLDQFYYEPKERIERVYNYAVFCTHTHYAKVLKTSSWEDIGEITLTDKNLFFNGQKFKFKTSKILEISWAHDIPEYRQILSSFTGQNCWIYLKYIDSLNTIKMAFISTASNSGLWLDKTQAVQLFNHLQDVWQNTLKPVGKTPSKVVTESAKKELPQKVIEKKDEKKTIEPKIEKKPIDIEVKSGINYEHARIIYKIKIENNSSSSIGDINVKPFVPNDIFIVDSEKKAIPLIKKNEAKTVTFKLRPKGECGNINISGNVTYFNTKTEEYKEIKIEEKPTQIVCPMLKTKPLEVEDWQAAIGSLISVKETTSEIKIPPDELFDIVSDVIKDMNMYMLPPKTGKMRQVGRFYAEGIKGFKYGVKVEVMGALEKSKLILNAYSENQECLIGFYYKILDEIEDRTNIKEFLKEPIIIHGDYIAGGQKVDVRDSVLQRAKIGGESETDKDTEVDWE
jgi:hypothetical protein